MVSRSAIEATIAASRAATDAGDWDAFVDCFAEDGCFMNSALAAPIEGREAIRAMAKAWPRVVNREEWRAIDGARLAIGWNEHRYDGPEDALYRGMSTFVFDTEGRILDYEGIFDPAKVAAAYARSGSPSAELTLEAQTPGRPETTGRTLSVVAGRGGLSNGQRGGCP
jgi:hypothetical protein